MAVDFDVKGTRTSEYRFLPEQIEILPEMNGRHELPDIEWLIESMLRPHGQIQPVSIRRTGGKPVLCAGFSRWRAAVAINTRKLTEKPFELRCTYTALTEKQAFMANIEENRVRNATTPMDDAYNVQRLINVYGMTEEEVAGLYREKLSWIKGRLQLIELIPDAEKALNEGRFVGSAAKTIAKLSTEQQRAVLKTEGKITAKDVRAVAKPVKPAPAPQDGTINLAVLIKKVKAALGSITEAELRDPDNTWVEVSRELALSLFEYIK